ncbi:MAG: hypothetical protein HY927_02775 [Elusimicrobia bacterium]|nr:hypothetical protein [Elusimicrobiota bacterium]
MTRRAAFPTLLALLLSSGGCASVEKGIVPRTRNAGGDPLSMRLANADLLLDQGSAAEAVQELRAAEGLAGPDAPARLMIAEKLGRAFTSLHDHAQAELAYRGGLDLATATRAKGPVVSDLYAGWGLSLLKRSRYGQAGAALRQGLQGEASPAQRRRMERDLEKSVLEEGLARGNVAADAGARPARISRIVIIGNRTEQSFLRKKLPFKEGDTLKPESLQEARERLYSLGLFKQVAISSSPAAGGEAEVSIFLRDGWYLIPFPFYMSGSGGARGGAFVAARNILRQSESFSLMAMAGKTGSRGMVGADWDGWSVNLAGGRREFDERKYADGGVSAGSGFGDAPDEKGASKYGAIGSSYLKRVRDASVEFGVPLGSVLSGLKGEFGWELEDVGYAAPTGAAPKDAGAQTKGHVGIDFGGGSRGGGRGDVLGAMLGFGMADLEERLKPLPRPRYGYGGSLSLYHALGSDYTFWYGLAKARAAVSWGRRQTASVQVAGGHGGGLPENQFLSTGRDSALQGQYARRFQGPSVVGASVGYSHPFWMSRRGILQGNAFLEGAAGWSGGKAMTKTGMGMSFWYRFWRFPIPIGLSYTYSFDDKDAQVGSAIGGMF